MTENTRIKSLQIHFKVIKKIAFNVAFPYVEFYLIFLVKKKNWNDNLVIVSGDMEILLTSWVWVAMKRIKWWVLTVWQAALARG